MSSCLVGRGVRLTVVGLLWLTACTGTDTPATLLPPASPVAPAVSQATAGALDPNVAATVDEVLKAKAHPGLTWPAIPDVLPELTRLYEVEPDRLFWFDGDKPLPVVPGALATLAGAGASGLDPADYDAAALTAQWTAIKAGSVSAPERALFDLGLTIAAIRLLHGAHVGRVDPATMHWGYDVAPKRMDIAAALAEVRGGKGLAAVLEAQEPPFAHYTRAKRTLAAYRVLAKVGEPEPVPELAKGQSKVEPGHSWAGVPKLAARLRVLGDLRADAAPDAAAPLYAGPLVEAVKRFQGRHGLEADGVLGAGTIKALNVSLARRVRQIELAMERMRWLPEMSNRPNIFVNVPLFRLWATDPAGADEPLRMNVVVGKSLDHKTPIFVEQMEYVIFRPYWNPPLGITVKEIVPHARRDPSYLAKENLEIVASGDENAPALAGTPENLALVVAGRLHIRQKPGPNNSLGLAKFIFPNDENVYMHGTPAQQLFSRARRDFSHGCIRLADPARLAEWVLRDQPEWTRARIDAAMNGDRPTRVTLKQPLTVVIFYDTVHVNSEGVVFFVTDIYGHDQALDAALRGGYPYPTKG